MFKNIYKNANKEIQVPDSLKASTIQKMPDNKVPKRKQKYIIGYSAAFAVIAIVLCVTLFMDNLASAAYAIAAPQYPNKIGFEDFEEKRNRREEIDEAFLSNLRDFSFNSASIILKEGSSKANSLYSPMSLYMALAMMAETANGDTQKEILDALGMNNMDMVSTQTGKLFRSLYFHNEIGRLNLANSLWLNEKVNFNKLLLEKMASDYYAHSFEVNFGNNDTSKKISQWVSEYTGGKLGNNPGEFQADPNQVMELLNTVYFYDQWIEALRQRLLPSLSLIRWGFLIFYMGSILARLLSCNPKAYLLSTYNWQTQSYLLCQL
jgi:serpin B